MKAINQKNILLNLVLVPLLILNVVIPRNLSFAIDYSVLAEAIKSQANILTYSSFAAIPMEIVQELFNQHNPAAASKKTEKKDEKKRSNAENELFTVSFTKTVKKGGSLRDVWQKSFNPLGRVIDNSFTNTFEMFNGLSRGRPAVCIIVFLCIFLLPRGSIEDHIITLPEQFRNTAKLMFGRVFLFYSPMTCELSGNIAADKNNLVRGKNAKI